MTKMTPTQEAACALHHNNVDPSDLSRPAQQEYDRLQCERTKRDEPAGASPVGKRLSPPPRVVIGAG